MCHVSCSPKIVQLMLVAHVTINGTSFIFISVLTWTTNCTVTLSMTCTLKMRKPRHSDFPSLAQLKDKCGLEPIQNKTRTCSLKSYIVRLLKKTSM